MKVKTYVFLAIYLSFWFSLYSGHRAPQEGQNKIVETVSVDWWQVPVFALDNDGNPVIDLKREDINVWVNGKKVEGFVFYKRDFYVTETIEQQVAAVPQKKRPQKGPNVKRKTIYLIFDLTLSSSACSGRAKHVARDIIAKARTETDFVLLTIEPFIGLRYVYGPTGDKDRLLELLAKKVRSKPNKRVVAPSEVIASLNQVDGSGRRQNQYNEKELNLGRSTTASYYVRRSLGFFKAFESMYVSFNATNDNKFVYLFTEGLSEAFKDSIFGGQTMFNKFLRKGADYLGRSGVVLFIVNPMGTVDDTSLSANNSPTFSSVDPKSGEDSLRYLAEESGGKYLEGVKETIIQTLNNMHRSYYEISFPDTDGISGITRKISIKPVRKGITVHTLHSLEKSKKYTQLSRLEQELLALNLISRNSLLKSRIDITHARVTKMDANENGVTYTVKLPVDFLRKKLDLYKFWLKDEQQVTRVEKQPLTPRKRKLVLTMPIDTGKDTRGTMPYFALIDPDREKALVRVIGDRWTDSDDDEPNTTTDNAKTEPINSKTFDAILEGAAAYCEKLKSTAFHFLCQEVIVETQNPLSTKYYGNRLSPSITSAKSAIMQNRRHYSDMVRPGNSRNNRFIFSYRLLNTRSGIKEERLWYNDTEEKPLNIDKEQVVKPTKFFSERAVFAPATLLAQERQYLYKFKFLGYDTYNGQRCAVIRGVPLDPAATNGFYGDVWIDLSDHSVMKVVADPRSINGYAPLKEFATKIGARLFFSLEMEFVRKKDGIRFPTSIRMLEKYKGGRLVSRYRGPAGWERTRTRFNYTGYRFFDIKTEVHINQ